MLIFEGRLILGQTSSQRTYPEEFTGDRHSPVAPVMAEMFRRGQAGVNTPPENSVLVHCEHREIGVNRIPAREFLVLSWSYLPRLVSLLNLARELGDHPPTFVYHEVPHLVA
jgi:hypothetical protein